MKTCTGCRYAEWQKTKGGKLHQSGDGHCRYEWVSPPIPASMYWIGTAPTPSGGFINRRGELKTHCPHYQR